MASALNSVQANNASGNASAGAQNPGRSTLRSNSTKGPDSRRQSGSPVDGGQRRTNSHKAWTQGTNPITQRSSYSSSNGNLTHQRQTASPRPNQKESNTSDNHAHDRLVFLFASFIGLQTTITTKSGDKYTGIFSSSSLEPNEVSFLLKMVQRASQEGQFRANGVSDVATPFLGSAPEHIMSFEVKDVIDISVPNVTTAEISAKEPNGASQGFRTDSDISGNLGMRERTLQRWEPAETDVDMSLETSNNATGWDQFEANERLFGAKTNYDENIYTTRLDRADPAFKQKQVEAARIAREIEGQDVDNSHMREERGLAAAADAGDQDEEDKYSGVRREDKAFPPLLSGQPNKYTPPGRRQPGVPARQPAASPAPAVPIPIPSQIPEAEVAPSDKHSEPTAALQPPADADQKSASSKGLSPAISTASATSTTKRAVPENATANVEAEVLGHFRQFAKDEKAKLQERRRNQASYDRTSKLNELMKFSKSFKLMTPVPKDLVPILAKDRIKQEAIISRAQQQIDDKSLPQETTPPTEPKLPARGNGPTGATPPSAPSDRQYNRPRQGYPPTGPLAGNTGGRFAQQGIPPTRPGAGMLSHRLADNLQQRKGPAMVPNQNPLPLPLQDARGPPTGPASEQQRITSPVKPQAASAATKFNVKAMEFKPNPAASTFTPGGAPSGAPAAAPSARSFSRNRSVSRATTPTAFFGPKKPQPVSERPSITNQFNPIKRMKKENVDSTEKPILFNGGIPPPFRTSPTWEVADENQEKTYGQMFKQPQQCYTPWQHALPLPAKFAAGLRPEQRPPTTFTLRALTDPPTLMITIHGYPSPMAPHAQLSFGQPVPPFYNGGAQPNHMRHYQGGPQFVNPQNGMGAPMMAQQHSNGPYMAVPQGMTPYNAQMPMYSPSPGHAYPHVPAPQPHSGYPSPSRGAPMMMHQNSQSGQPPMFMPGQPGYPQQSGHMVSTSSQDIFDMDKTTSCVYLPSRFRSGRYTAPQVTGDEVIEINRFMKPIGLPPASTFSAY
ncbi:SM domain found in ataxin-2 [Penicillium brevicompactum]|uniref:SM domain found in ataxin-2 n=1 Tax=Penicillium brevicompactum TaxID=5074 RepID=UPI00254073AC|nr:SM domain found in ataxin-2 [Penicillium brevicompactum]KAJ5333692.1 SM domain found in ataxin-2 [Penicillium brevicompactum]